MKSRRSWATGHAGFSTSPRCVRSPGNPEPGRVGTVKEPLPSGLKEHGVDWAIPVVKPEHFHPEQLRGALRAAMRVSQGYPPPPSRIAPPSRRPERSCGSTSRASTKDSIRHQCWRMAVKHRYFQRQSASMSGFAAPQARFYVICGETMML